METVLLAVLGAYLAYYARGRAVNSAVAADVAQMLRPLLEEHFASVGEGAGAELWQRESDSEFSAWCSGRRNCQG